ncbi:MAG: phosphatidylglycerophosphatase A [Candidatus Calescibacterium sp.]|jgi:phosphatidylglycerophosphatase A|nr:phosphatidylglycerophosphatase A [Candidatus Calescibacterium sp.]
MKEKIYFITLTFFGVGKIPIGQGTVASLISGILYFSFISGNKFLEISINIFILAVSFLSIKKVKNFWEGNDPHEVVIDEVAGMFLSLLLLPKGFLVFVAALLIFRFLDITKIPPIIFFDRMKSPYGILLDDIVSGVIANFIVRLLLKFNILPI